MNEHRGWRWIAGGALLLYVALTLATILTREPWCDEAWFNSPALTLATKGYLGTPYLDPASNIGKPQVRLDGINRYTYWMTPLYMLAQTAWIKVAGFGLVRARLTSMLWGLAALIAWWRIASRLAGNMTASLAILLLGVEYNWIYAAADARMETMCAALGAWGLALYLELRDRNFTRALLLANVLIAASALTHPMGVLYGLALVVIALAYDRSHLAWRHLWLCAAPYLVALAAWALYIAQAPQLFRIQFIGNSTGRGPGITHPIAALMLELTHRFGENFGLAAWTSGPARAKILPLLVYAAGLVCVTASRRLRANLGVKLVWMAASAVLLFCWLFEGTKNFMYLPHILPWLCILAAIALTDIPRWAATLIVATVVSVQILSTAMPARRNPYGHLFVPAMDYLEQHTAPSDTIMGDAVIGFALGWNRNVSDDAWLGYKTGKKTDWIVITPVNASLIDSMRQLHPDVYRHVTQLLAGYSLAYENTDYKIYASARSAVLTQ